jgi:hypothetical protein
VESLDKLAVCPRSVLDPSKLRGLDINVPPAYLPRLFFLHDFAPPTPALFAVVIALAALAIALFLRPSLPSLAHHRCRPRHRPRRRCSPSSPPQLLLPPSLSPSPSPATLVAFAIAHVVAVAIALSSLALFVAALIIRRALSLFVVACHPPPNFDTPVAS